MHDSIPRREGWSRTYLLDLAGVAAGFGSVAVGGPWKDKPTVFEFHYNRPYGDVYMEVNEPFRRRGLGVYLVQELKRACYALGAVPCARCNPQNVASRRTLQSAGFVPFAQILTGSVCEPNVPGRVESPSHAA